MAFERGVVMRRRRHHSPRRSAIGDLKAERGRPWMRKLTGLIGVALVLVAGAAVAYADTPSKQIVTANLVKDKIIAIDQPKFIAANDAHFLQPQERMIGVVVNGVAKAYPIRILDWHEVVNDVTAGKPIAVTFCPLTGDAAVYERTIDGKTVTLSPLNKLYESDTILRDSATHSLWAQANGKAISGPEKGKQLTELASITTVWRLWKSFHPKTLVLSTDTGFARNYGVDPYVKYERGQEKFPVSKEDERLPRDEMVLGVEVDNQAEAFPFSRLALVKKMPLTVRLGGRPITIVFDPATGTAGAADEKEHIPAYSGYWFGWSAFHPQSEIWGKPPPKPIGPLPIVFKTAGDLNQAREGNSATLLKNGKVLIAGGDNGRSPMLAAAGALRSGQKHLQCHRQDGVSARRSRSHHPGRRQSADNRGMDDLKVIRNAEVYDPDTGQFKAVQSMSAKREKHTATLLKNGQVLVAGGFSGDADPTPRHGTLRSGQGSFVSRTAYDHAAPKSRRDRILRRADIDYRWHGIQRANA